MKKLIGILGMLVSSIVFIHAQSAYDLYESGLDAMLTENYDDARSSFDQAISLDPDIDDFYLARGELLLMQNKHTFNQVTPDTRHFYSQAKKDFEKVLELNPRSFEGWYGRARLRYMFLEFRDSQADYDGALKAAYLTEDKVLALGGRGACQYRLGEIDGAMRDLERALSYAPNNSVILNEFALIYIHQGETAEAIKALNTILKNYPDDPIALANMGYTALKAGKYAKALKIYDEVLQDSADNAFILSNRAFCLLNLDKLDEALADINESIAINDNNSFAFKNRALIHLAMKNPDLACEDLQSAKSLGFTLAYGQEVVQLLRTHCLSTNRSPSQPKK